MKVIVRADYIGSYDRRRSKDLKEVVRPVVPRCTVPRQHLGLIVLGLFILTGPKTFILIFTLPVRVVKVLLFVEGLATTVPRPEVRIALIICPMLLGEGPTVGILIRNLGPRLQSLVKQGVKLRNIIKDRFVKGVSPLSTLVLRVLSLVTKVVVPVAQTLVFLGLMVTTLL